MNDTRGMGTLDEMIAELETPKTQRPRSQQISAAQGVLVAEGKGDQRVLEAVFFYMLSPNYHLRDSSAVASFVLQYAELGEQERKEVFDKLFTVLRTQWQSVRALDRLIHELKVACGPANRQLFPPVDELVSLITYVGDHTPDIDAGYANTGSLIGRLVDLALFLDFLRGNRELSPEAGLELLKAVIRHPMPPSYIGGSYGCTGYYRIIPQELRPPKHLAADCLPYVVDLMERGLRETSRSEIEKCRKDILPLVNLPGVNIATSALELLSAFPEHIETIVKLVQAKQLGEEELWCLAATLRKFRDNEMLVQLLEALYDSGSKSDAHGELGKLLLEMGESEEEPRSPVAYDVVLGSIVQEETPYPIFPSHDEVFVKTVPDEIRAKFLPLVTLDLQAINPSWKGKAHFLYHETVGSDEIRFRLSKDGLIAHLESDIPLDDFEAMCDWEDPAALEETLHDFGQGMKHLQIHHQSIESEPAPCEDQESLEDWGYFMVDYQLGSDKALVRWPYPDWVQTNRYIPNHKGRPMRFVAQLTALDFGLCDWHYYLFYDPHDCYFCQLMQLT
jgi:hypothetical protein